MQFSGTLPPVLPEWPISCQSTQQKAQEKFLKDQIFFLVEKLFAVHLRSQNSKRGYNNMLIIDSKDCENIDKALKKYKKKYEKSRVLNQLRERQSFTKPSVRRRTEILKAVYKQQMANGEFADK